MKIVSWEPDYRSPYLKTVLTAGNFDGVHLGHQAIFSSVIAKAPRILQGPGTDEKVIAKLSNALKSGAKFEGKAINYKKDGTPFIMFWRVMPIKDGKKIVAWVAIQREGASI